MVGKYYPDREIIYHKNYTVKDALFVSDGFVACYSFDDNGNRQVIGLYGKDTIIAGNSFMSQQASEFDWIALPGTYLMKISYRVMDEVYTSFPDAEELARLIIAVMAEKELKRLTLLKEDAATVVLNFYQNHHQFSTPGALMSDGDVASYLLIKLSTLRNTRVKLLKDGKLKI